MAGAPNALVRAYEDWDGTSAQLVGAATIAFGFLLLPQVRRVFVDRRACNSTSAGKICLTSRLQCTTLRASVASIIFSHVCPEPAWHGK